MAFEFKLPDIGEGLTEGEVVKWLVKEGDTVQNDQPMVEVMTDKATVEITAPRAGVIEKIHAAEGQTIPVGSVMVVIGDGTGAAKAAPADGKGATAKPQGAAKPPAAASKAAPAAAKPPPAKAAPARAARPAPQEAAPEVDGSDPTGEDEDRQDGQEGGGQDGGGHDPGPREGTAARAAPSRRGAPPSATRAPAPAPRLRDRTLAAPATRRRARELGVDIDVVPASGPGGRLTRTDLEQYVAANGGAEHGRPEESEETAVAEPARVAAPAPRPRAAPPPSRAEGDQRVPLKGMRARIAEQMVRSKQFAPHFTYADECDMTELVALKESAKETGEEQGVKVTFLPFVMKALSACFRRFPTLNAHVDEEKKEYVVRRDVNIGIATDTEDGLTVPVVKHVDQRSVLDIAAEVQRLTEGARSKKIALEDLKGGTFTITSAGSIGGILATPILNHPEVGILGIYKIVDRPVVRDGAIVVRKMANLSITLDHRIVDGATAARFMNHLIRLLQTPALLLFEDA